MRHWIVRLLLVAPLFAAASLVAQSKPTGGVQSQAQQQPCLPEDEPCGGSGNDQVVITGDPSDYPDLSAHTTHFSADFLVYNDRSSSTTYALTCSTLGAVACEGLSQSSITLGARVGQIVTVFFATTGDSGTSGAVRLSAAGPVSGTGTATVTIVAPRISFGAAVAGARGSASIHTRRPVIRAVYSSNLIGSIDTAQTRVTWRGEDMTRYIEHVRGLLEWHVDPSREIAPGSSAALTVRFCLVNGQCSTEALTVTIPSDQRPLLDFTAVAPSGWGGGFGAGFGPGIAVSGAEIETGFATTPYFSFGAARSASLLYSTRTAYPRVLVPVNIELPWPIGTPDQVKVYLLDGVVKLDSTVVNGVACLTGAVRQCRTVLQADFGTTKFAAPTRKWLRVEVNVTSGGVLKQSLDSVEVILVDRRRTQYGAGWWPAALSRLVVSGSDRLLIGPTGTATIYRGTQMNEFIGPPGSTTALVQTAAGWELLPRGSLAKVVLDTLGRVVKSVDADGNRDSLTYAGTSDTLLSIIDPLNKVIAFSYSGGKLQTITSLNGLAAARQNRVTIDASNRLIYDSLSSPAARPAVTRYVYQPFDTGSVLLVRRIGVLAGDTTKVVYDSTFRRRPLQAVMARVQNELGVMVTPTIGYGAMERRGWHGLASVDSTYVEVSDPRGNWTRSLLGHWGGAMKSWDALGLLGRSGYDAVGRTLWSEGKNVDSSRVYVDYDVHGRMARSYILRSPTDRFRMDSLVYDANHRVVKRIDPKGQADSAAYDAEGHLVYARDPSGAVTLFRYTAAGQLDSTLAPTATAWTHVTFDTLWRQPFRTFDETGKAQTETTYDAWGRVIESRARRAGQQIGSTVSLVWGRSQVFLGSDNVADSAASGYWLNCTDAQTVCTAPSGPFIATSRTVHRFDVAGRDTLQIRWIGTRQQKSRVRYDGLGRVVAAWPIADLTTVRDSMVYDVAGNLVKRITRRGHTITAAFDSRNRDTLTSVPGVGDLRRAFAGPNDQLTRAWYVNAVDSIGSVIGTRALVFDARGRLKIDSLWAGTLGRAMTYTYDTYERTATASNPILGRTFGYEAVRGMLERITTSLGDTLLLRYDARGRVIGDTLRAPTSFGGSWLGKTVGYKVTGELATRALMVGGGSLGSSYVAGALSPGSPTDDEYTGSSLLARYWARDGAAAAHERVEEDATQYDGQSRLMAWNPTVDSVAVSSWAEGYGFDDVGNLTPFDETRIYDSTTNRLLYQYADSLRSRYSYDAAGNQVGRIDSLVNPGGSVTFKCSWQYGYDALERMTGVWAQGPGGSLTLVARYGYDVLGQRIARKVYAPTCSGGQVSGASDTRYAVWEGQVQFETNSTGTVDNSYLWGPGVDDLRAAHSATTGAHVFAVTDKLGSVRAWIREDGTYLGRRKYGPYGAALVDSVGAEASPFPYRWTGREYDPETGFYFNRARYYHPRQGRFTQEDPIGEAGGSNLYAYVEGQPLEARDPSGMISNYLYGGGPNMVRMADERFAAIETQNKVWDDFWIERGGAYGRSIDPRWQAYLRAKAAVSKPDPELMGMDCPESKKKNGVCPGGLTDWQWDRATRAAWNNMTYEARTRLFMKMDAGQVHAADLGSATGRNWLGSITIDFEVFSWAPGDLAWVLSHEVKHSYQSWYQVPGNGDANAYACANTWGRVRYGNSEPGVAGICYGY